MRVSTSAVGMAIFFILAPPAKAQPQVSADAEHALAKGDRLRALVKGAVCSARSWPNYDQICQFDLRTSADHVRPVRVLDLEGRAHRSTSSSPLAEYLWTRCAFFPRRTILLRDRT